LRLLWRAYSPVAQGKLQKKLPLPFVQQFGRCFIAPPGVSLHSSNCGGYFSDGLK
jgi:hypothetical protein